MVSCSNCGKEIKQSFSPFYQICKECFIELNRNAKEELNRTDTQAIKSDNGKPRLDLVPLEVLIPLAQVREYGLKKYGKSGMQGWKQVGKERYLAALLRHLVAYQKDNNALDEESGLPAIYHVLCNAAFLAIKHLEEK